MVLFGPLIFKISVLEGIMSVQTMEREKGAWDREGSKSWEAQGVCLLRPVFPTPEQREL